MKKRILLLSVLLVGMAVLFSTTTALAVKPQPVGDQLNLEYGPDEFAAGTPFHITHGFWWIYEITEPIGNGFALSKMTLEVNGIEIDSNYIDSFWFADPQGNYGYGPIKGFEKLYTFNFPNGMESGDVTFIRHYYFTCQSYLKAGQVLACEHPTSLFEDLDMMDTKIITFK